MNLIATLEEIDDTLRRRWALVLGVFGLGLAVTLVLASAQRPIYRSVELLQITPPRVAQSLAPTTVAEPMVNRLAQLRRQVLSDGGLSEVATAYELYRDAPRMSDPARIKRLRESVQIAWQAGDDGLTEIRIAAWMPDAENARLVAQELSHRLIGASVHMRIAEAQATLDFLSDHQTEIERDLGALQTRFAAFQRANVGALAGSDELRKAEMASLSSAIVDIDRDRVVLEHQIKTQGKTARLSGPEERLAILMAQRAHLSDRRAKLVEEMQAPPGFLAEMQGYERELTRLGGDLAEVSALRARARTGLELETRRQSERLVVSQPAVRQIQPESDIRARLLLLGSGISACIAFAIAVYLEYRHPVVRTPQRMLRMTGRMPIVTVPAIDMSPPGDRLAPLRRRLARIATRFGVPALR